MKNDIDTLVNEYRSSMNEDILREWAEDLVQLLKTYKADGFIVMKPQVPPRPLDVAAQTKMSIHVKFIN